MVSVMATCWCGFCQRFSSGAERKGSRAIKLTWRLPEDFLSKNAMVTPPIMAEGAMIGTATMTQRTASRSVMIEMKKARVMTMSGAQIFQKVDGPTSLKPRKVTRAPNAKGRMQIKDHETMEP